MFPANPHLKVSAFEHDVVRGVRAAQQWALFSREQQQPLRDAQQAAQRLTVACERYQ